MIERNERFLARHGELEHFVATRHENGTIEFRHLGEEAAVTVKDALAAMRLAAGATLAFDCLIADTPLLKAMKQTFGRCQCLAKDSFSRMLPQHRRRRRSDEI